MDALASDAAAISLEDQEETDPLRGATPVYRICTHNVGGISASGAKTLSLGSSDGSDARELMATPTKTSHDAEPETPESRRSVPELTSPNSKAKVAKARNFSKNLIRDFASCNVLCIQEAGSRGFALSLLKRISPECGLLGEMSFLGVDVETANANKRAFKKTIAGAAGVEASSIVKLEFADACRRLGARDSSALGVTAKYGIKVDDEDTAAVVSQTITTANSEEIAVQGIASVTCTGIVAPELVLPQAFADNVELRQTTGEQRGDWHLVCREETRGYLATFWRNLTSTASRLADATVDTVDDIRRSFDIHPSMGKMTVYIRRALHELKTRSLIVDVDGRLIINMHFFAARSGTATIRIGRFAEIDRLLRRYAEASGRRIFLLGDMNLSPEQCEVYDEMVHRDLELDWGIAFGPLRAMLDHRNFAQREALGRMHQKFYQEYVGGDAKAHAKHRKIFVANNLSDHDPVVFALESYYRTCDL